MRNIFLRAKNIRFMYYMYFRHACPSFDSLRLGDPMALIRSGSEAERKQSYNYERGQVPTATWARYFTDSNHRALSVSIPLCLVNVLVYKFTVNTTLQGLQ
jgi:hypothetical protein